MDQETGVRPDPHLVYLHPSSTETEQRVGDKVPLSPQDDHAVPLGRLLDCSPGKKS